MLISHIPFVIYNFLFFFFNFAVSLYSQGFAHDQMMSYVAALHFTSILSLCCVVSWYAGGLWTFKKSAKKDNGNEEMIEVRKDAVECNAWTFIILARVWYNCIDDNRQNCHRKTFSIVRCWWRRKVAYFW